MTDSYPECRTAGSRVNPGEKVFLWYFITDGFSSGLRDWRTSESVMKCQNVVILPGSSQGSKPRGKEMKGHVHVDICMYVELLQLIFKEARLMKNKIFLY